MSEMLNRVRPRMGDMACPDHRHGPSLRDGLRRLPVDGGPRDGRDLHCNGLIPELAENACGERLAMCPGAWGVQRHGQHRPHVLRGRAGPGRAIHLRVRRRHPAVHPGRGLLAENDGGGKPGRACRGSTYVNRTALSKTPFCPFRSFTPGQSRDV